MEAVAGFIITGCQPRKGTKDQLQTMLKRPPGAQDEKAKRCKLASCEVGWSLTPSHFGHYRPLLKALDDDDPRKFTDGGSVSPDARLRGRPGAVLHIPCSTTW